MFRASHLLSLGLVGCATSLPLLVAACASQGDASNETSAADLTIGGPQGLICSRPAISEDGAYIALDECPAAGGQGRIVRLTVATGATAVVETYGPNDVVDGLSARANRFYYAIDRDVASGKVPATDAEVHVRDWSLTEHRTFPVTFPADRPSTSYAFKYLFGTADGNHLVYALADGGTLMGGRFVPELGAEPKELYVAPTTGAAAPVRLTSLKFDTLVLSRSAANAGKILLFGDSLQLISMGGPQVATVSTLGGAPEMKPLEEPKLPWEVDPEGLGAREPRRLAFDGSTVVGEQFNSSGVETLQALVALQVSSPVPTVLFQAARERDRIFCVNTVGSDLIFRSSVYPNQATKTSVSLVKVPRTGGAPTVLHSLDVDPILNAECAFETAPGAPYAVARVGTKGLTLVDLGGGNATPVVGDARRVVGKAGAKVFVTDEVGTQVTMVDLATGIQAPFGIPTDPHGAVVAADGSLVRGELCPGGVLYKRSTPAGETSTSCNLGGITGTVSRPSAGSPKVNSWQIQNSGAVLFESWTDEKLVFSRAPRRVAFVKP